jgi:hypothetical protein
MDFQCPNKMRTVTTMFWINDGAFALATERRSLDGKCASTYDVHYFRK